MLRYGCLIFLLVLAVLIAIPVIASRYVPGWAVFLIVVGEVVAMRYLVPFAIGLGLKRFAMGVIQQKSQVLRNAAVHVYSVERTTVPAELNERLIEESSELQPGEQELIDVPGPAGRYVLVDFTITPQSNHSPMKSWEPVELMLIPSLQNVAVSEDDDKLSATVAQVEIVQENGEVIREFDKVEGKTRLRAIFNCPPLLSGRVKFRYYFETFGDLLLPP